MLEDPAVSPPLLCVMGVGNKHGERITSVQLHGSHFNNLSTPIMRVLMTELQELQNEIPLKSLILTI